MSAMKSTDIEQTWSIQLGEGQAHDYKITASVGLKSRCTVQPLSGGPYVDPAIPLFSVRGVVAHLVDCASTYQYRPAALRIK